MKIGLKDKAKMSALYDRMTRCLIIVFGVLIITKAFLGPILRGELESNEYPIVAIQYRGSIVLTEAEVENIKKDFPALYDVSANELGDSPENRYPRLERNGLKVSEGKWYYWYFPIYPMVCLPVKLLFQALGVDQERCFTVTNALMVLLSLWFVYKKLKVPSKQRLILVALLVASPVWHNVNYIYYLTVMSAFVTMSLVQYYNGSYKSSALLLSIAGMSNASIMAVGIVMITEYLIKELRSYFGGKRSWDNAKRYLARTAAYGVCYIPCLSQFAVNRLFNIQSYSPFGGINGYGNQEYWFARFLMYLFDPTLGFSTFAPVAICIFLVLIMISIIKRNTRALVWGGFFLGTVAAYSLMFHINCGMIFCARYLVFSWPIVAIYLSTDGYELIRPVKLKDVLLSIAIASSCLLLYFNASTGSAEFNRTTQLILRYAPQVYAPYNATFYCRTLHVGGGYNMSAPAYYVDPKTDEIRKLIYKAEGDNAEQILYDLTGDDASIAYLEKKLQDNGSDGKYHYINFPVLSKYKVREKTLEEKGEVAAVDTVVDKQNFGVGFLNGVREENRSPFNIVKNTIYKVEIELDEDTDFDIAIPAGLVVDFYGPGYDRSAQQKAAFIKEGKFDYTFFFDSGDMDSDSLDGYVRLFASVDMGEYVDVDALRVTEMKRVE